MERQWHGFAFQEYVYQKYNVEPETNYTGKWDGYYNGIPVSIKHIKKGNAVDMADLFRQATNMEDFYMFVDFYTTSTVSDTDDIHILFIPAEKWKQYFLPIEQFEKQFKNALDNVSNDKADDAKWTKLRNECVTLWKQNTNKIITVNGKRDHKNQKRWQCSINKTNFFKEIIPNYSITEEEFYARGNKK